MVDLRYIEQPQEKETSQNELKLQFSWIQAFSTEEILKHHTKDCFKINGSQRNIMPKKGDYVKFKNYERKIKSPFNLCRF